MSSSRVSLSKEATSNSNNFDNNEPISIEDSATNGNNENEQDAPQGVKISDSNDDVKTSRDFSSGSSTGSNSSDQLRTIKSAAELTRKNTSKKHKYQKPHKSKHRLKQSLNNSKPSKMVIYDTSLDATSESTMELAPEDCYRIKEVGNVNSTAPFVCSMYITSYNAAEDQLNMQITIDPFAETINKVASGKIKIQKTFCGITVMFTREDDADKVIMLPLQKVFGGPVQVTRFSTGEHKFRQNIVIKDIPWCVPNTEIHQALKMQGIKAGKMVRTKTHVRIELFNALDVHRLLEEGLNFFNCTSFSAVSESNLIRNEPDIVQCFRCQGFWHTSTHCRQLPRCVRCGENHDVEYCPRPRNAPICCHCGGSHHAAYKMCPVRLQHINSIYVGFTLARNKPVRSYPC